jgi:anaerobic selenocysteine-containing dehydrogenase
LKIHFNVTAWVSFSHGMTKCQYVNVSSIVDEIEIEVVITGNIQQGAVSMPQGWGIIKKKQGVDCSQAT